MAAKRQCIDGCLEIGLATLLIYVFVNLKAGVVGVVLSIKHGVIEGVWWTTALFQTPVPRILLHTLHLFRITSS